MKWSRDPRRSRPTAVARCRSRQSAAGALVAGILPVAAAALVGSLMLARAAADPPEPLIISIETARNQPLGSLVVIEGIVTVPAGSFRSAMGDEGFAIQDGTGGIYVSIPVNVALRARVPIRVTGRLTDRNGLLVVSPAILTPIIEPGYGEPVETPRVATGLVGETTEGQLVAIEGKITRPIGDDLPAGQRLFVDDGSGELQVYVCASTQINLRRLQPGQRVRVVGFSGQYNDQYLVLPRSQADLRR